MSKVNDKIFAKQRHDISAPPPIQNRHLKKHASVIQSAHAAKSAQKHEPAKHAPKGSTGVEGDSHVAKTQIGDETVDLPNYMRSTKASRSDSIYSTVGVENNRSISHGWWC